MDQDIREYFKALCVLSFSRARQVAVLLLADTVNAAFDLAWIYGVLINKFGLSLQLPGISQVSLTCAILRE